MSTILPFLNFVPTAARASLVASLAMLLPACGGSTSSTTGDPGGATSPAGAPGGGASPGTGGAGGTTPSGAGAGGIAAGGMGAGAGGCNQPTISTPTPCNDQYPATSILALRNGKAAGCFALSHVGLVARTDSPTEPRLYLQDAGGADLSALMAKCTATATHACAPAVKAKIPLLFDTLDAGAQLSIRGYYQYGAVTGFEEFYIEDIIDECKTVPRPAPIALSVADLTRDARVPGKWFRRATVSIPVADPLVAYDFSPPELLLGLPQCPDFAGFAMIQKSKGSTAAAACTGQVSPAPRMPSDPNEILIGRQFFNQFLFSADCACAAGTNQRLIKANAAVSGSVLGYLILEQEKASAVAYQVFEPASDQSFPIQ